MQPLLCWAGEGVREAVESERKQAKGCFHVAAFTWGLGQGSLLETKLSPSLFPYSPAWILIIHNRYLLLLHAPTPQKTQTNKNQPPSQKTALASMGF